MASSMARRLRSASTMAAAAAAARGGGTTLRASLGMPVLGSRHASSALKASSLRVWDQSATLSKDRTLCSPAPGSSLVVHREKEAMAAVQFSSPPVNALSLELCRELTSVIAELDADPAIDGILLGSAVPGIFSAGLDLRAFHGASEDDLAEYWTAVQEMWLTLYTTRLATVAAVNGHAPAGGCMLALSCDERVMVDSAKYRIGLSETQVGIVAPPWLASLLVDVTGVRRAYRMLLLGELVDPQEALARGIVDEVAPLYQLYGAAERRLSTLLQVPSQARSATKQQFRRASADALRDRQSEDLDEFVNMVSRSDVQVFLGKYLESLKKKHDNSE